MARLEISDLRVAYTADRPVVDGVDLRVPAGTLTALLGPSGCGKTTLLRAVAGLLGTGRVDPGSEIRIDGSSVLGRPAERRPVGLVFQKPLLFGHLSVLDNVAFGLRMRGVARRDRHRRAEEMLERVALPGLGGRRVGELSGGQEQRVALARALVLDPQVLLLDEPFSQLDADLRVRMRELVRRVQRELGITMLFVTHDQQEAVDLADAVALMLGGRIDACGAPAEFYLRPATLAAARFFGVTNEVPGTCAGDIFTGPLGRLAVAPGAPDGPGVLVVRPEAVHVVPGPAPTAPGARSAPDANTRDATVAATRFRGTHHTVELELAGGVRLVADMPADRPVRRDDAVHVRLPAASCRVLPEPTPPATGRIGTCATRPSTSH